MRQLENYSKAGVLEMVTSRVTLRETERTKDEQTRRNLKEDINNLTPVAEDEKVLGFQTLQDQYGGSISYPLVSDVQDEKIFSELCSVGLPDREDTQHLTQAICNESRVFLTVDERTIIKHRNKIESRFPIRVRKPSELLRELKK